MIKNKKQFGLPLWVFLYTFAGICLFFAIGLLQGQVSAVTSDIARWYLSEQQLSEGEIVAIKTDKGDYVESAASGEVAQLLGVVVAENEALISIDQKDKDVQVAIAGRAQAKVNLSNGPIARGDLVGISDEEGIGARAKDGQPVVGIAEASFGVKGGGDTDLSGFIPVLISVGVAPSLNGNSAAGSTWLRSIAGNNVTALQLTFVLFIAAIGLTSIVVLTYSSIRNGVISVGRNPLAKPAILSALAQAMIMVSVVAISSFGLMYFILRL